MKLYLGSYVIFFGETKQGIDASALKDRYRCRASASSVTSLFECYRFIYNVNNLFEQQIPGKFFVLRFFFVNEVFFFFSKASLTVVLSVPCRFALR